MNPLDNGRTYNSVMQKGANYAPKPPSSVVQQATHNGTTNFVGGSFVKPLVRTSMALNQGIGNAEIGAAHALGFRHDLKTQNAQQFSTNTGIPNLQKFSDYKGTKRQIAGDLITNVANIAAPGSSKIVEAGVTKVAGRVIPKVAQRVIPQVVKKVAPKVVGNAIVGAPVGAASNVGSLIGQDGVPLTRKNIVGAAKTGAEFGAAGGAVLPVAGALASKVAPHVAKQLSSSLHALPEKVRANQLKAGTSDRPVGKIPTSKLTSHEGAPDRARVDYYKQQIQAGKKIDPIIALKDAAGNLGVEDGKHRFQAYKELGIKNVPAKVTTWEQIKSRNQGGYVNIGKGGATGEPPKTVTQGKPTPIGSGDAARTSTHQISSEPTIAPPRLLPNAEANVFAQNPMSPTTGMNRPGLETGLPGTLPRTAKSQVQSPLARRQEPNALSAIPSANDSALPIHNTKRVSGLDKAFRSTRSIIERQGEHGRQLAGMLQGARDSQEIYLAQIQKRLPLLRSLKGKNYENFVDATQGLAKPASTRVAQAVKEWQSVHPEIRNRAVNAGLDVGDLGQTYYPHFIDYDEVFKDVNKYNKSINYLVETGQATDQAEAIKLLNFAKDTSRNREFGNLESSRLIDLPYYDKTPNSLISYLNGSAKRTVQTETFGKGDENALSLITKAGQQGFDTEAMKNAYDVAVGAKRYNPTASTVSGNIRKYVTTTRLGLGALTNVSQNVNTGIVTGHLRTLGAAVKQFDPKTRDFVADTGVISDAILNDLKTQSGYSSFTNKVLGKVVNKITAPGFGAVEKFNRSVSATAGRDYALRLAQKGDESTLRKLGVTGEIKGKTLDEAQQIQAARKVVEKTQFKVDPQDLPGWTDSPGGKLVSQFRTFSYAQGKFFSNEVIKPAAKGNLLPLGRLLAALPVGYGLYETKRAIAGRPEEEDKKKIGLQAFSNVGGAGLIFDLYNSLNPIGSKYIPTDRRTSMAVGAAGGPAVGVATQGIGAISEAIQRKNTPTDASRLEGKVVAGNNGDSYSDLTPLSRFGIQQVPIVGTAIKNRVLPFKTEANADAGKTESLTKAQQEQLRDLPDGDKVAFIDSSIAKNSGEKLTSIESLKSQKAAKAQALKDSLSNDDYKLSQLSKADQKKLVASGAYTQKKVDGLNSYVANKKKTLGIDTSVSDINSSLDNGSKTTLTKYNHMTSEERDKNAYSHNDFEYNYQAAKYANDKANGKLSKTETITGAASLAKAKVGSKFSKDVRELYGLSKAQLSSFLGSDENGKTLYSQLQEYDNALVAAGLAKTKFKYGLADGKTGAKNAKNNPNLAALKYSMAIKPPTLTKIAKPGKLTPAKRAALRAYNVKKAAISKTPKTAVRKGQVVV